MTKKEANKYLYIDMEYNNSQEKHPNLVCCSWSQSDDPSIYSKWLHKDKSGYKWLAERLQECNEQGYIMVAYAVTAEARCFEALGLDPLDFKWLDLYLEWKQLQNRNNKFLYGHYFDMGRKGHSYPPKFGSSRKDNTLIKGGLVAAVGHQLKIDLKPAIKDAMRDLILENKPKYSEKEKVDILAYCDSDIVHLHDLRKTMARNLWEELGRPQLDSFYKWQYRRGEDAALAATHETEGIPVDLPKMKNLRRNVPLIKEKLIKELNELYPFFVWKKKTTTSIKGKWTFSNDKFKEFVETHSATENVRAGWPKTESKMYSTKDEDLKFFDNIPLIKALRHTRKILNQIKWFREPEDVDEDLFDSIGSDGRMRSFFGLYGSQTGRSQPSTKRYIPLMSAWLHCLIKPPEGHVIIAADYSSQEFAIAASLSKDKNMEKAYISGDPYLWFGKEAKGIPQDGTKASHPAERYNFKATTLAVQFGMGGKSLGRKLTADTGKKVDQKGGEKLINMHKKVYPQYWKMLKQIRKLYQKTGRLQLPCGWALFEDTRSILSALNFPVQGRGSTMLHLAVKDMRERNLKVIYTKHDEIVVMCKEEDVPKIRLTIDSCMTLAYDKTMFTKDFPIRIDMEEHRHEDVWISEKGEKYYDMLHPYLEKMKTREDRIKQLMETVFK